MTTARGRPLLKYTWIAMFAAVWALVCFPLAGAPVAPTLQPAVGVFYRILATALGAIDRAYLAQPAVGAALGIVSLGILADVSRWCLSRRRRQPMVLGLAGDLMVWKGFVLALLLAATLLAGYRYQDWPAYLDHDAIRVATKNRQAKIRSGIASARSRSGDPAPRIIMVGDSIAGSAFYNDTRMKNELAQRGSDARFIGVWCGGVGLSEVAPSFDALLALRPAVVLVEASVLFVQKTAALTPTRANRWSSGLSQKFAEVLDHIHVPILSPRSSSPDTVDLPGVVGRAADPGKITATLDRWENRRASGDDPNWLALTELKQQCRQADVPLVIVVVPTNEELWTFAPLFFSDRTTHLRGLAEEGGVTVIEWTHTWPSSRYSDLVHLTGNGRDKYCGWLIPQLVAMAE